MGKKIPFSEAIRSEIHVLDTTRKATARNCAPCLSNNVGTWKASSLKANKNHYQVTPTHGFSSFVVYSYPWLERKTHNAVTATIRISQLKAFINTINIKIIDVEEWSKLDVMEKNYTSTYKSKDKKYCPFPCPHYDLLTLTSVLTGVRQQYTPKDIDRIATLFKTIPTLD